jgi:hypothetical protein
MGVDATELVAAVGDGRALDLDTRRSEHGGKLLKILPVEEELTVPAGWPRSASCTQTASCHLRRDDLEEASLRRTLDVAREVFVKLGPNEAGRGVRVVRRIPEHEDAVQSRSRNPAGRRSGDRSRRRRPAPRRPSPARMRTSPVVRTFQTSRSRPPSILAHLPGVAPERERRPPPIPLGWIAAATGGLRHVLVGDSATASSPVSTLRLLA